MTTTRENCYRVGSFAWIERENVRTLRAMLDRVISAREIGPAMLASTVHDIAAELAADDSDTLSEG